MQNDTTYLPLLSVTVLNYNYGHYLKRCLDSILAQTFTHFELIIINDCSTDNSLEVLKAYDHDARVRIIDHPANKGFVASLIEGCELSKGRYLTVISADDWVLQPTAFEHQVAAMEDDKEIAFVYSAYAHFDSENQAVSQWRAGDKSWVREGSQAFRQLVLNPFLLHTGTVIRASAYKAVGGYEKNYRYAVDARMWLSLCHVGKVAYLSEVLYAYRRHDTNMSKSTVSLRRGMEEVLAALDWSFAQLPPEQQSQLNRLHTKATRRVLVAFAIDEIFRNRYRAGWYCYGVALKLRPFATVWQKATPVLFLRSVLGRQGFSILERLNAPFSRSTRQRLQIQNMDRNFVMANNGSWHNDL